ncbi:lamin tail domain-containing protein [bacterium]|nr:lamin tail domain-containing protein [bacterium]
MNTRDLFVAAACALALLVARPAHAAVMLNEITVKGLERVELYNSGPGIVDVNGWTIEGGGGTYQINGADPMIPDSYEVFDIPGAIFFDNGGFIELLDDVGPNGRDGVWYGQLGSAPLPPAFGLLTRGPGAPSLARAPDGSAYSLPPSNSPGTDGLIWTIDFTPTFGAVNDAPNPALGSALVLNEADPKPVGGLDTVELVNPSALPVPLAGWLLTNGESTMALSGSVPGGGFLAVTTDPGFDIEDGELLYLFDPPGVRVDQLGFHLIPVGIMPTLDTCQCFGRFPDGTGPNIGYDWLTSGGSGTLDIVVCTPGLPNVSESDCGVVSVEPAGNSSWGSLKAAYR